MADLGTWNLCAKKPKETLYLNLGPTQGPVVIYRVHNRGPAAVVVGGAVHLDPGDDCDVSGARVDVALDGPPLCGAVVEALQSAVGTYELLCCEAPPQVGTPAAAAPPSEPPSSGAGGGAGTVR